MDLLSAFNQFKENMTKATTENKTENSQKSSVANSNYNSNEKDVSLFSKASPIIEEKQENNNENFLTRIEDSFLEIMNFLDKNSDEENNNISLEDSIKKAGKKVSSGEVFEVPGSDTLFIKTASGDYKKLNISPDTYEKIFTNPDFAENIPDKHFNYSRLSENIEKLFTSPESKEILLSSFSEDDKGNVTFTIPNSDYKFTLEKGKSLNDYDIDMEEHSYSSGVGMIELALGKEFAEKELSNLLVEQNEYEQIIDKEKNNYSPQLIETFNNAIDFAKDDLFLKYEILDYYELTVKDAPEEKIKKVVSEDMYNLMQNIPKEELKNINPQYVDSLVKKEINKGNIKKIKEDPYYNSERDYAIDETMLLSKFGLNKNLKKINDKTLKQAEELFKEFKFPQTNSFDTKILATLIDDNKKGQEIIDHIKSNGNTDINYSDLQACLRESLKEDSDIKYLKKLSDLNIEISTKEAIDKKIITTDNIDLISKIQNKLSKKDKDNVLSKEELKGLNSGRKYFTDKEILEQINNENISSFINATNYIDSILKDGYIDNNTTRSNLLKTEINNYYNAIFNGKSPEDIAVPSVKSISDGLKLTNLGDVFEVEGEDQIYLTTNNNQYIQLDISKDTYNKLFPPIQKYIANQGDIGDCYLVSTLNNMMTSPSMRGILLKCFSEDKNGNITVDLPNGNYTFTLENGKEISDYEDEWLLSDSSTGIQMLELCYGIYYEEKQAEEILYNLTYIEEEIAIKGESYSSEEKYLADKIAESIYKNSEEDAQVTHIIDKLDLAMNNDTNIETIVKEEIIPFANEREQKILIKHINSIKGSEVTAEYIYNLMYKTAMVEELEIIKNDEYGSHTRGKGGLNEDVFESFGIECDSFICLRNSKMITQMLENQDIKIVSGGTNGNSDTKMLNDELSIAENHAYTIYPKQKENGEYIFEVINPWDEAHTSILTLDEISKYFYNLDYIYL